MKSKIKQDQDSIRWQIYYLSSSESPKCVKYVGFTSAGLSRRLKDHIRVSLRNNQQQLLLYNWVRKITSNGETLLITELQSGYGLSDGMSAETAWIWYYLDQGYSLKNASLGGEGMTGYKHTAESRAKISAANIGNKNALGFKHSDEFRRNLSIKAKNQKQSRESIERGAAKKRGRKHTEEHKRKISEAGKGKHNRPMKEATKRKLSELFKGKPGTPHTEEHKEYMRQKMKGREYTPETIARMSAARKGKPGHKRSKETNDKIIKTRALNREKRKLLAYELLKIVTDN
jgi:hypothetical protein